MTAAREYDSVRTTTDIVSDDGRTIPAGIRGGSSTPRPTGPAWPNSPSPQTADTAGDFVQAVLTEGQYEIIRA